ncbi:MAG: single-stranded-DNA-specific exonuclease RecJ [Omnitrophica WOR_2 bacterium RBG_13_44_8b]|nr:MAG: single-stranded-DNA-specific exonuclease RecJ [Omnitrophica WOR_2 bacterium RBG_13_44_8b]
MHTHKILKIASPDNTLSQKFSKELGISELLSQILLNRGIVSVEEANRFLNVNTGQFLDPYDFKDMQRCVNLIKKAASEKHKVMIFGDYDVDGITALTLLKTTLKSIGIDAVHYLPHRIKEGYGLSKNIVPLARQENIKLLITVDCGTGNHKEIEELRHNNIDVIVTDHHESVSQRLPPASGILNPKLKGSGYKYRDLAGVGVAYKLCQAISRSKLLDELDLVSLGTIADNAPLSGENRIIAKQGLLKLSETKREGLKALIRSAGIKNRKFTSTFVSFILAPRINASGRMDTAEVSLNLLLSKTQEEADKLAGIIEGHNRQRQKVESRIMDEAEDLINKEINFKEHKIIVIAKENWHQGVLGIVASKLADRFYRPAIVISLDEDLCKGSARSIKNFHLFDALLECKQFLSTFGGHAHAAGLVITRDSIEDFKHNINRLASQRMSLEDLLPSLEIDAQVGFADLNEDIVEELQRLEPFGTGNPEPLFYTRNLKIKGEAQTLSRETLKFWVTDGDIVYQAIGFGMSNLKNSLMNADYIDLVYSPRIDDWAGETGIILEIREIFFR